MLLQNQQLLELIEEDENCYSIKRIYENDGKLALIQVLDGRNRIYKCLFYENGIRLSNMCIYNTETGKEIRNITYKLDGKTISSIREYDIETEKLTSVTFYKSDENSISSIIEYDKNGEESQFTLFCDDGEIVTQYL